MRMDLIETYFNIYKTRNVQSARAFRKNYETLSELWLNFTDEERKAVNIMLKQINLTLTQ